MTNGESRRSSLVYITYRNLFLSFDFCLSSRPAPLPTFISSADAYSARARLSFYPPSFPRSDQFLRLPSNRLLLQRSGTARLGRHRHPGLTLFRSRPLRHPLRLQHRLLPAGRRRPPGLDRRLPQLLPRAPSPR